MNGEGFLYLGRSYRLKLVEDQPLPLILKNGYFSLRTGSNGKKVDAHEVFKEFYREKALRKISERVEFYAPQMGVTPKGIKVLELQHRWASCTKAGMLNFHWKCMMAPLTILDYIVVHELAHMIHANHTEAFWNEVDIGDGKMEFSRKEELVPPEDDPSENVSLATTGLDDQTELFPDTTPKKKCRNPPLDECLESDFLKDDHIISELTDRELNLRLRRLHLRAKESLSEQGVHSLFLGFGLLKWYESNDSEDALFSPLMLVPVNLDRRTTDAPWTIKEYEDDAIPNYSLGQLLKDQFDVEMPVLPQLSDLEDPDARRGFLEEVREAIADFNRWEVLDDVVLNTFSFQKIAMWQDLGDNGERIGQHDLCRSIAGDESIRVAPCASESSAASPSESHTRHKQPAC